MRLRNWLFPSLFFGVTACGGGVSLGNVGGATDAGDDGATADAPAPDEKLAGPKTSKVDLLLVLDDSASMGDKLGALSASIGTLIRRVAPKHDVHVGVINTSLGSMGGDVCADDTVDGPGHLRKVGPGGAPVAGASASGFLAFDGTTGTADLETLVTETRALVEGVGETGCGFEAQLESAYRFLVQPDPWARITKTERDIAQYEGIDATLLAQRKAFLRPDSLVVVVLLTDEEDSSVDPRSIAGQGWAFASKRFPGSTTKRGGTSDETTAPRATSVCATDPQSTDCTTCGFAATCNPADAACQRIKSDPNCLMNGGYYGPTEDQLNVRFHRMKERYGIDPQFPLSRYVDGFTNTRVPDRSGEHAVSGNTVGPYLGTANCTNPLFAASLPGTSTDELCDLAPGPRDEERVVFALVGGVPERLVGATPDWTKILGTGPYDATGQDPHMIQSIDPRPGLPPASSTRGDNGTDPDHGREWTTSGDDLQYACTFALPAARTCASESPACDCASTRNPPLCGADPGVQLRGKAYPTIRELRVVKELGARGIAGSICPTDATTGYVSTMRTLGDRLEAR